MCSQIRSEFELPRLFQRFLLYHGLCVRFIGLDFLFSLEPCPMLPNTQTDTPQTAPSDHLRGSFDTVHRLLFHKLQVINYFLPLFNSAGQCDYSRPMSAQFRLLQRIHWTKRTRAKQMAIICLPTIPPIWNWEIRLTIV